MLNEESKSAGETKLSDETQSLLGFLSRRNLQAKVDEYKPKVDLVSSMGLFAFVYEKARNFVDYQEEHLLLRRAITRILIRRVKTNSSPDYLVKTLVDELLMARYIQNGFLPEDKLPQAIAILNKYLFLFHHLGQRKFENGESLVEFVLSLAAREIEELFVPSYEDQLLHFALKKIEKRVVWQEHSATPNPTSEEDNRARLLTALMRSLTKYEDRTIYYKFFKLYFPEWENASEAQILEIAKKFSEADSAINRFLNEPQGEILMRVVKKVIAPFEIMKDLIGREYFEVEEIFSSPEKLSKAAFSAVNSRYQRARSSLRRSAVNSFIYIFITKMVLALAIEIPFEMYLASKVNYLPIIINLLFPPSLMVFMALSVESPTEANTKKIVEEILSMSFGGNGLSPIKINLGKKKSSLLSNIFRVVYLAAFLLVFGGTIYLLRKLQFSVVSLGIFFFFLSTVSFFAFRIRSSFRELVVGEEDSNFVSTVFDFFMLPFIKLGRTISSGLRGLNVFMFFFDIILEAPFKLVLEVVEAWIRFLREKKEEALNVIK